MNKKLVLLVVPFLLAGCGNNNKDEAKAEVVAPQMVAGLYRQHNINMSFLTEYKYSYSYQYNPIYVRHGADISNYIKKETSTTVGVYSGVFVAQTSTNSYEGNQENAGIKTSTSQADYYWFEQVDENTSQRQLTYRTETKDRDQQKISDDTKLAIFMDEKDVSSYFSGAINDSTYSRYFTYKISPLVGSTSVRTADDMIISTTYECLADQDKLIPNPDYPDDKQMALVPFNEVVTYTTFRYIENIGWVGTNFSSTKTQFVCTDNRLHLSTTRSIISSETIDVSYAYSQTLMSYTGGLSYQEHDKRNEEYSPIMYRINSEGHRFQSNIAFTNITSVYKSINISYEGYAYQIKGLTLDANSTYSFVTKKDNAAGLVDKIGGNELIENASGLILPSGIEGQNSIKTLDASLQYDFIILVDKDGNGKLIARLGQKI